MLNNNQFNASYTDINTLKEVTGKELTSNDFTDTLKTKVDALQEGGGAVVNADWNSTSGASEILNKPKIPTLTTEITDTTNKRYQTDNQQSFNDATSSIQTQLNAKQSQLNGTGFVKASGTTISYDNSVYAPIIAKQILLSSITGTTTNTIISSHLLSANLFSQNDFLDILCSVYKPTTSNNATLRVYLNSSVSLTGATLVGTYTLTSTTKFVNFQRTHVFLSTGTNGQFWGFPPTVSSITDRAITNIEMTPMMYNNQNNGYIIFALQLSNSADQVGINAIKVTK